MLNRVAILLVALTLALSGPARAQDDPVPGPGAAAPSDAGPSVMDLPAPPPPCGTQVITIARMQWPSAAILAEIHARLLRAEFACTVDVVPGDLAATGASMGSTGQPGVAPEMWISRIADIWNAALKAQLVRPAGPSYAEPVFEGWFVPDYVVAAHPDLTSAATLATYAAAFGQGGKRGKFISCPPDWACAVINRNLLATNGLETLFEVVEPANRFELDTLIAEAVSRKEPIVFYYWQPNAVLAQFGFAPLDLGPYDREAFLCAGRVACAAPAPTGFAPDPVIVALADWVYLEAPEIAAYFQRARMPFAEMNALLQNLSEPGASIESVADAFVAARGAIWQSWVGRPAIAPLQ